MYAIRSYYAMREIAQAGLPVFDPLDAGAIFRCMEQVVRITSYNVCYTKLLRVSGPGR